MKEQYITDTKGRKVSVVLPIKVYREMLKKMEELEDVRAYDASVSEKEEPITAQEAFAEIEAKRNYL